MSLFRPSFSSPILRVSRFVAIPGKNGGFSGTQFRGRQFFCSKSSVPPPSSPPPQTLTSKISAFVQWLRITAKEKGKPFIAWYVFLYFGGLVGAYGIVRWYGKVEPELVREWALKLKVDKIVDVESIELTKQNCEYFAALLLNESVDTPRLILAVLTIDRIILLGRKVLRRV